MNKKRRRLAAGILFVLYFIVLFYFLFFSEEMGRVSDRVYHYNLVPFKEIVRFVKHWEALGIRAVLLNIVGNMAAFLPFGAFLPIFSARCRKLLMTAFYSLELSLLVELLQLVFRVGSFDVDDLLLNTLGGVAGFLIYKCISDIRKKKR